MKNNTHTVINGIFTSNHALLRTDLYTGVPLFGLLSADMHCEKRGRRDKKKSNI
jgi:hypothetical protein